MGKLTDINTIFQFFFKTLIRSKRTKLFFFFAMIPAIIFIIFKIIVLTNPESHISTPSLYIQVALPFFYQLFIQILALFYGTSVLTDEIENQTLIYLTTSPVSKTSILIGKFAAHFMVSAIIYFSGLLLSFIIANFSQFLSPTYLLRLTAFTFLGFLGILAYSAIFTLMGTFIKKTVIIGIFLIFGFEKIIQFFPGTTQKLCIIHYIKSLMPVKIPQKGGFLVFNLEPSSTAVSITVLLLISVIALAVGTYLFNRREYILANSV